jgi:hypothetical protein
MAKECLPFVVLKPLVRGRIKRRKEQKDGGGYREVQPIWWGHF